MRLNGGISARNRENRATARYHPISHTNREGALESSGQRISGWAPLSGPSETQFSLQPPKRGRKVKSSGRQKGSISRNTIRHSCTYGRQHRRNALSRQTLRFRRLFICAQRKPGLAAARPTRGAQPPISRPDSQNRISKCLRPLSEIGSGRQAHAWLGDQDCARPSGRDYQRLAEIQEENHWVG
jgi:hypothetical protein